MLSALGTLLSIITACFNAMVRILPPAFRDLWGKILYAAHNTEPCEITASNPATISGSSEGSCTAKHDVSSRSSDRRIQLSSVEAALKTHKPSSAQRSFSAPDLRALQTSESSNSWSLKACQASFTSRISEPSDPGKDMFNKLDDCERGRRRPLRPVRTYSFKF